MPQARAQGLQGNWREKRDRSLGAEDYCGAKGEAILLAESIQIGQRALQGSVVDRTERLAELPANLVDFLRSRGLALTAERGDGGPQAAPVRGIVYTPDQFVGLEAIHELGDVGSHTRASRGQLAKRHRLVGLHQMGQGGELGA